MLVRSRWIGLERFEPGPPKSAAIANDLHKLLQAAGIPPPYVLVGASFSGFNVRVFAGKYPSEVVGMVLSDAVHEDQQKYEPRSTLAPVNRLPAPVRAILCRGLPIAAKIGVVRLLAGRSGPPREIPEGFTAEQGRILSGLENQPRSIVAQGACDAWEKSAGQARASGKLGDIPLIVLTAGKPFVTGEPHEDQELAKFHDIWVHQLQPQLASLSKNGRQIIVENSGHAIALDAEVSAIREVVSTVRKKVVGRTPT